MLAIRDPVPGDQIGDYEVEGHLARGGMASVLAVRDLRTGLKCGFKLLLPMERNDETQSRFRREFRALSRLHHPNVLRVHESGVWHGRPWFTMELVEGHDLRTEADQLQFVHADERFVRVEGILRQIARALAYVHERGLVHRDVTPGNLMVTVDGTVKLMDFGVVKETDADLTGVGELIGTVAYMAPEQISGEPVDARADLYSLGAVLYLLLTGKRPFVAHTIHGFMEKHLNAAPRPPHEVVPEVPPHLEEICLRLLNKAPADRFASATHLLHLLGDNEQGEDLGDRWPPATVGRTMVRARLREAIDEVATGRPGTVLLVTGPAGIGKTRILEVAEQIARRRGLPVAQGRCRLQDRPFGAFASIYRTLRPGGAPAILDAAFLGADDGRRIERYPVLAAFRDKVVDRAPLVLMLDDLGRADPATIELLTYLIRNTLELATEPVLFVLGCESGSEQGRAIEQLAPVERFELTSLDPPEVEELVVSVLGSGEAPLGLAERLYREGAGSPAFIADMLRALIDDGLIVAEKTGRYRLAVDASQITQSRLPMPASLRAALQERLAPLSPDALSVARVLALARRRIEFEVLVDASPIAEDRVMEALDALVDAEIVEEHRAADQDLVELSHGRFREVLVEGMSSDERRALHQRIGEALERHHRTEIGAVVPELAHQFERAELWPKAYAYTVQSALHHLQRSLYHEALDELGDALAIEPRARPYLTLDAADRHLADVWLAASRARGGLGRTAEAVEATTEAQRLARLVREPRLEAQVATELGTVLRRRGELARADEQLSYAIERAEASGDQTLLPSPLYELGGARWSRGDLAGAEGFWRRSIQIAQQVGDERAQGQGLNGLAILAICRGQLLEARRLLEQSATVFERLGMLGPLVVTWANLIETYAITGVLRKALALADRMAAQAAEVEFPQGIALGRGWR
ncbi:MAG: protein kinase, partial [Myxococcota bacterium]